MGFYERRIFPWLNDVLTSDPELRKLRGETLAGARGRVIEIGFGTGGNLPYYPPAVVSVTAVEPSDGMLDRAAKAIGRSSIPVEVVKGMAERMPLPDASFDSAVATLTLCSVEDPGAVLSELRRVLRDDGRLMVLEHGLADDPKIARWQQRLNGLQRVVACGCNLNRPIAAMIESAGFRFENVRRFFVPRIPRPHGWVTAGTATKS
jgi:SAM-dependent methyltransferase